jgi:hypothetical protein
MSRSSKIASSPSRISGAPGNAAIAVPLELSKAPGVIAAIPTEWLYLPISLESQDPPAVAFLLVYAALPMEGACDWRGVHEGEVGGEHL